MANITPDTITALKHDRYQVYVAPTYGPFILAQGLQTTNLKEDIPVETIDEIGNDEHRGTAVDIPVVSFSLDGLNTDSQLLQIYSDRMGWTAEALGTGTSFALARIFPFVVGPLKTSGNLMLFADADAGDPRTYHIDVSGISTFAQALQVGRTYQLSGANIQNVEISVDAALSGTLLEGNSAQVIVNCENEWEANELKNASADVLLVARDNSTVTDSKGVIFKNIFIDGPILQSLSTAVDANGNATETFENECSTATRGDGYYLRKAYICGATDSADTLDLDAKGIIVSGIENPIIGKTAGSYPAKYFRKATVIHADGTKKTLTEMTASASGIDGYYSYATATRVATFGNDLLPGDRVELTYFTLAQNSKNNESVSGYGLDFSADITAIKGRYIPVRFGIIGSGIATLTTAQSATVKVDLKRERIKALGDGDTCKYAVAPIPDVTGDLNILAADMTLPRLLGTGNSASTDYEFSSAEIGDIASSQPLTIRIRLNSPNDSTTKIKEYEIDASVVPTTTTEGISVGGNATQNFSWSSKRGSLKITR